MADPLVATTLYAVTRGILDFSTYDGSRRWWVGFRMRLWAAKLEIDQHVATINAHRLFAELTSGAVDPSQGQLRAQLAVKRIQSLYKPWKKPPNTAPADNLDGAARWYIIYAREKLEKLGVNFGALV